MMHGFISFTLRTQSLSLLIVASQRHLCSASLHTSFCRYTVSAHVVIRLSLLLARLLGSHWVTKCTILHSAALTFLQCVSIASYAERCISHDRFCLSDRLSDRLSVTHWYHAKRTQAMIMGSSLEDSPMILVSSWLTSAQNSKGNIGSEGAEWERGRKNRQFLANKSPYLENGAR